MTSFPTPPHRPCPVNETAVYKEIVPWFPSVGYLLQEHWSSHCEFYNGEALSTAFIWTDTHQGDEYWRNINYIMRTIRSCKTL